MNDYLLNFEEIEGLTVLELIEKLNLIDGLPLKTLTLKDLIFFNGKALRGGRGVYLFKDEANSFFYVGMASKRSFIERIPAHFDTKPEAWMNTLVKYHTDKNHNINNRTYDNLENSAMLTLDTYSLIMINFLYYNPVKIANFGRLLRAVLGTYNQIKNQNFDKSKKISDLLLN
ncbi:hypothetical protein Emtol_2988 [Emticicia oligotrophica DSM 17448]|uniref:GIY-YIG domain-containing protein n=1 Tax=Emticicia oligotrophica (strain DSM 17448 / CIP 109782 / MTCC 6937 / GPTSA100-15) TaxID=929562 RepID=A0ABN4AQQ1_EMTOG|nr:hypothetical protein [Emticicia oligotrophica]AFK04121.1 hypothetical protein Emtol_2988 [Emticicia oligotrophica DSM 17448]